MISAKELCAYALYSKIKDLPDMERRIVHMIIERIHTGLREYGSWEQREHRNEQDILEEQLDQVVYGAAAMLDLVDKKGSE